MGGVCDAELLERFVRGRDEAAFELLVWRHGKMVFGVCRRLLRHEQDAEDAFQATFVALARRAGALSRRESVGGWLYRVAYRIGLRARADTARRTARQRAAALRTEHVIDAAEEAASRELRQVIDEEVNRLPAKYRVPFVLCQLGGYSNAEAARELGCPVGTVESWLARARRRLRGGLTRRGVVVPAGSFAAGVIELAGSAEVSAALTGPTARAALLVIAGRTAGGVISARVLTWAEGALPSMYASKIKIAAALLITVGLAGTGAGVGGWGYRPAAAGPSGPSEGIASSSRGANDRIAKLVRQLGSERFAEREQAVKELDKLGPPALAALREAAKSTDPEVKRRAAGLARNIEERQAREEILRPKRVHLVYKDTPLHEALGDFQKKSGYRLTLHDPNGKLDELAKRPITLDTGDVTFWEALELFCKAAGLVEAGGHATGQPALPITFDAGMPRLPRVPQPAAPLVPPALPGKGMGPRPGGLPAPAVPAPAAPRVPPPPPGAAAPLQPAPAAQPGQPHAPPAALPPQAPGAPAPRPGQPPQPPGGAAPRPPGAAPQPGQPPPLPAAAPPRAPGAPAPPPGQPPALPVAPAALPGALMPPPAAGRLPARDGVHWQGSESASITLREGELRNAPTVQAGAIRLRLLDKVFGQPVEKGEFMLQIAAEPNLGWRRATAVRIDKAVDDRGQRWQISSLGAGSSYKIAMDVAVRTPEIAPACGSLMPLVLTNGDKRAKSLKELKGVITAEVLSRPKTLLTIEDVRKANGETFELPEGGVCKIGARRATANEVLVDVEFIEIPPLDGPRKMFTCVLSTGDESSEEERKMDVNISPPEIVRQRIHIALAKNSKPLRLVLRRQNVLTVTSPFTFKDVPLL
jgi:RNA polymerase sigma factor (sigma-70 family)